MVDLFLLGKYIKLSNKIHTFYGLTAIHQNMDAVFLLPQL